MKKFSITWKKIIILLLIVLLAILIYFVLFPLKVASNAPAVIVVGENTTPEKLVDSLYENGMFRNSISYWATKLINRYSLKNNISTQGFSDDLASSLGALALLSKYVDTPVKYVVVKPGMRKEEIAQLLEQKLNWSKEKVEYFSGPTAICLLDDSEGYLYPNGYIINSEATARAVREAMIDAFESKIISLEAQNSPTRVIDLDKIVIIASLVQKESGGKEDMATISGVIWNRLFQNMNLDIDATLQYAKGKDGNWWPKVYSKDKYINSLYNTYQNKGLPPGPIANPGEDALFAAMNPEETHCLFYLHDRKGNIYCSETYKEHKANIATYLR